jgi:hypothetical protein
MRVVKFVLQRQRFSKVSDGGVPITSFFVGYAAPAVTVRGLWVGFDSFVEVCQCLIIIAFASVCLSTSAEGKIVTWICPHGCIAVS